MTTNYNKLAEQLVGDSCLSLCPGQPIPRSTDRVKTYHVHGSIDSPIKMVVTAEDYFNFMSCETYFSRKLSTILHENTVIIMGYPLGDTNLKAILNNYRTFVKTHHISNNIIFVAKGTVEQCIVDYYATCYGIRVIQKTEIETFFQNLDKEKENAEEIYRASIDSFRSVFTKAHEYEESFLKKKISFYSIISSIAAEGKSLNDPHVVSQLDKIINIKQRLAGENGAWDQYVELASWLCYLGTILDVRGTQLENTFCSAVAFSMNKMRRERKLGYSWDAYKVWANDWQNMRIDNRLLIKTMNKEELEDFAEKFIKQAI
ncbi:SIR2 family protein [Bartonella sp. HY329]|nr:SIR2 family protein [Bartonella sp. HY329]UXN10637.1 SIR2 family protein [Bartonella sp. HY328]